MRIPEQELADLEAQRDSYKQHAEALAVALRSVDYAWTNYRKDYKSIGYETIKQARAALAAWDKEGSVQQ